MITRNALHGILVLLAGLSAGYFASRCFNEVQGSLLSDPTLTCYINELPAASLARLGILYDQNQQQFTEILNQASALVREKAFRKQELEQSKDSLITEFEICEELIRQAERELAILRLNDYFTQFYMHYFRWLDTGNEQSAVQYKLALGQFKATWSYTLEKHGEHPLVSPLEVENPGSVIRLAEQSDRTIRWARVLVVILIFLLVMGIPRFIRNIGYKRFSASLYFDAVCRPNLISGLNSWHSKKRMVAALLAIYLFAMVLLFSFNSWWISLIFGGLGLLPLIFYTALSYRSGRLAEILISFLAPKMLILILVLGMVAIRGTGFLWYRFGCSELFRTLFICLLFMLIFHKLRVNTILLRKWSHRNRRGSFALVILALGLQVLVAGVLLYIAGPAKGQLALSRGMLLAGAISTAALLFFLFNRKREDESTRS